MDNARQQIVDAVTARLQTITKANGYSLDIGTRVFPWRKRPLAVNEVPAICFEDGHAAMQTQTLGGTTSHSLEFTIDLFVAGKTTATQARSGLADIMAALATDETFGGLVVDFSPGSHEITMLVEGDICGAGSLVFHLEYYTGPGAI